MEMSEMLDKAKNRNLYSTNVNKIWKKRKGNNNIYTWWSTEYSQVLLNDTTGSD
jgi:hypothetical protein